MSTNMMKRAIALVPLLLALAWCASQDYAGLHGQDAHDYLHQADKWAAWWHGADVPAVGEHPPGYPLVAGSLSLLVGDTWLAVRIVPFLSFVLLIVIMGHWASRVMDDQWASSSWTLLLLGASPFLLRHALVATSDLPAIALCTTAWYSAMRWTELHGRTWILLCLGMCALAVCARFAVVPLLAGLGVGVLALKGPLRQRPWMITLTCVGLVLSVWAVSAALPGTPLGDWSPMNLFRRTLRSDDGVLRYPLPNGLYVLKMLVHPGFIPMAVLLLPFVRKPDVVGGPQLLAGAMVVAYLVFIAGMPFQNDRVLLLAQPFVAVLFAPAFHRAWCWAASWARWRSAAVGVAAALQLALFIRAMAPSILSAEYERAIAEVVRRYHVGTAYTHGMGAALRTYCPATQVNELWYAPIEHYKPGGWVIVDPTNLAIQWKGRLPEQNFRRAQAQGLVHLADLAPWAMFEVR